MVEKKSQFFLGQLVDNLSDKRAAYYKIPREILITNVPAED
jgi:hypothetical protein